MIKNHGLYQIETFTTFLLYRTVHRFEKISEHSEQ